MSNNLTHGMTVDEVNDLGRLLQTKSDLLRQLTSEVDAVIGRTIWEGPDAGDFKQQWWPEHRGRLQQVAEQVHGFGQSALNNASEQTGASDTGGPSGPAPVGAPAVRIAEGATGTPGVGALPGTHRTWQEVQRDYEANWQRLGLPESYSHLHSGAGARDYGYQCTAWANFRWRELGYRGPIVAGNGWEMASNAPGDFTNQPLPGAMVSTPEGNNHVMIVEEVLDGGSRLRVSEMNTGSNWMDGDPQEYRADRMLTRSADGWVYFDGSPVELRFKNLPPVGPG